MMEIKELWQVARELVGEEELTRRFRAWIGTLIRNARLKREKCDSGALEAQDVLSILSDLNERTKSRFQATDKATHLIVTLLKKGYGVDDFYKVHEVKAGQWLGNEKMEHCLRPSTLYAPSHFDEYLAEWWKQDRERKELQQKRQQALDSRLRGNDKEVTGDRQVQRAERDAKVKELNGRKWNEHASWLDFMRWTIQFPDAESLEAYPMPERVRKMRKAPGMLMQIATGKVAEWAEVEYRELKQEAEHGKN
jgi:uncharacterized phage protein (TIGR02220 family)